ncbi:hypothetical protein M2459_002829 [Parabacteroides sp. PF5-5]|uniref:DUF3408 domain-containing protein n=1 Tax=unclassified Parabacteroides TaxID=2649774 RepID=UPI0024757FDA|nr:MULTISPECIES: DUF3408 domain-containing protein [unclassified Parabacteroides]MDH6306027.1 hypothetical protein [Parabacteroides sp. PH5-39]MDH6317075.1 hypothetical protein [Parabacteroides sp. PF5-13]MDH6320828.1 hypothetical protein [Parabacteroides sp. PH5-13]MDH6324470.1 hypothetical protein [Parabacteroides sp. PH5-8]MDH6328260.1 hypothetical protein [Parabacteroides sp. PH5-41]
MAKRIDTNGIDPDLVINSAKPSYREKTLTPYDPSASASTPSPEPEQVPEQPPAAEAIPVKEKETPREETRRRKPKAEPQDYVTLFLHEAAITARSGKTVYICQEHHDRIANILHVIGKKEVSLFSYIYNVLEQHFATYQDEITELYEGNIKKIF